MRRAFSHVASTWVTANYPRPRLGARVRVEDTRGLLAQALNGARRVAVSEAPTAPPAKR